MCLTRLVNKIRSIMPKIEPKDFLLNTDYELDKIILVKTGSFTNEIELNNDLNFTPLVFGVWSTDSDFTSATPLGNLDSSGEYGYTPPLSVQVIALSDNIRLTAVGENHESTTIYYRVYAMAPPEANSNTPTTSKLANSFMINSDYNYRKLKAAGTFTQQGQSYNHNLGYLPQVMAWAQYADLPSLPRYSNGIVPLMDASYFTDFYLSVTPNQIKLADGFPITFISKVYWRIYYDEA